MPSEPFEIILRSAPVDPPSDDQAAARQLLLQRRKIPAAAIDLREAARHYRPSAPLCTALNVALRVGAPLLLTGEPGTGKTQVAHYVARYFGLPLKVVEVRSTSTTEDLLYQFDQVGYFRSVYQAQTAGAEQKTPRDFVIKGALWEAIESPTPTVVLIDEIDKAPRDLPNDLLGVLDQRRFRCREWHRDEARQWIQGPQPPVVIITSNSERRLPDAFLRRCIFHEMKLTPELVQEAVKARRADYLGLSDSELAAAVDRFFDLRGRAQRKKPALAELLLWLVVLAGLPAHERADLSGRALAELPALGVLIKDRDDLELLR